MRPGARLTPREYDQRLDEIVQEFVGRYGEVVYETGPSRSGSSVIMKITVKIPGWDLPQQASMVFAEKHVWLDPVWERYTYLYDLHIDPRPNGRYAYHWQYDVPHRHCEDPKMPRPGHHYEGTYFDDIGWAAENLFRIFCEGISCVGLRPLRDVPPELAAET